MPKANQETADLNRTPSAGVRILNVSFGAVLTFVSIVLASDLFTKLGILIYPEQILAFSLGCALLLTFINVRGSKNKQKERVPIYDIVAGVLGLGVCIYVASRYSVLSRDFFYRPVETATIGFILIPLVLEAVRRSVGYTLFFIAAAFILYGAFGDAIPGPLRAQVKPLNELLAYLALDNVALLGLALTVVIKVILLFILMGQLLLCTGGSTWFTELAAGLTGRYRGGSAKVAVVASTLFGTISGSAVANVVSTGVITIPMMRKAGFRPNTAAGVEAVASTGGQFTPPVMGAAAFLMAEFLQVPYREVLLAAIIPALLFYVAIFVQVDLEAARRKIPALPADQVPRLRRVLREGWYFALPFAVLIVLLFNFNRSAEESALAACLTLALIGLFVGYRGQRVSLRTLWAAIVSTGGQAAEIVVVGAMACLIIGVVDGSGLGFGMTFVLLQLGDGQMLLALLATAASCIILGMGMPTTGIYILLASLAAPALIKLGVPDVSAHFFVLYFGCLSAITPPVAVAAYAAATLARGNPLLAALEATRMGWVAFLIPFLFVYSPTLLFRGDPLSIAFTVGTALVGVWFVSAAMMRHFIGPISLAKSVVLLIIGLMLFIPPQTFPGALHLNILGIVLGAALIVQEALVYRKTSLSMT